MITYCAQCLYPSTKPDLWFKDGVCGACHSFSDRKDYDWQSARNVFHDLMKANKKNPQYDCIVPVSGGKDSTYQVWRMIQEQSHVFLTTVSVSIRIRVDKIVNLRKRIFQYSSFQRFRRGRPSYLGASASPSYCKTIPQPMGEVQCAEETRRVVAVVQRGTY